MQEGIGRGGYRVLAIVFFAMGVLGLVGTLYAFLRPSGDLFNGAMLILDLIAMTVLFVLVMIVLARAPKAEPKAEPKPTTFTPQPAAVPPPPANPDKDLGFEFNDDSAEVGEVRPFGQSLPEVRPKKEIRFGVPEPPPRALVVPKPNKNIGRDSKGWPSRQGPSGMTRGEWKALQQQGVDPKRVLQEQADDEDEIVVEALVLPLSPQARKSPTGATRALPARHPSRQAAGQTRSQSSAKTMTIARDDAIEARLAFPNSTVPPGMARGRCGSCDARLFAPTTRPLNLRCPSCGKVTRLG